MSLIPAKKFYSIEPRYNVNYMRKWEDRRKQGYKWILATSRDDLLKHYRRPTHISRDSVKRWLTRILLWGYVGGKRAGEFDKTVGDGKCLDPFIKELRRWRKNPPKACEAIAALGKCCVPEFGKIAFGSKLLMFWNPSLFVTLDSNVLEGLRLANNRKGGEFDNKAFSNKRKCALVNARLCVGVAKQDLPRKPKNRETYSSIQNTCELYRWWCEFCNEVAVAHGNGQWKASDVERLYFAGRKQGN